jgi:segregation and condensation protein B
MQDCGPDPNRRTPVPYPASRISQPVSRIPHLASDRNMEPARTERRGGHLFPLLECLLFVAQEPVTPAEAGRALGIEEAQAYAAFEELRLEYASGSGLKIARVAGGYQMRTRPEYAEVVQRFLEPEPQRLSRQAVETVAVIAYRQPVTLPEIDALRGVSSCGVMKTLLDRGLIRELGRKEAPGRPILYGTTPEFLKHFGLSDLSDLPRLEDTAGVSEAEAGLRAA